MLPYFLEIKRHFLFSSSLRYNTTTTLKSVDLEALRDKNPESRLEELLELLNINHFTRLLTFYMPLTSRRIQYHSAGVAFGLGFG